MKTNLASVLLLAAVFATPVLADELMTISDGAYLLIQEHSMHPTRGMPRAQVKKLLGTPSLQLSPTVWIYYDFRGHPEAGPKRDTLIVTFVDHHVTELRLADRKAVDLMVAKFRTGNAQTSLVAK